MFSRLATIVNEAKISEQTLTLPTNITSAKKDIVFREISKLYEMVDAMIDFVAADDAVHRERQLRIANPFFTQVTISAHILRAFYVDVVYHGRPITPDVQDTIEKAIQNVFVAMADFQTSVEDELLFPDEIDPEAI